MKRLFSLLLVLSTAVTVGAQSVDESDVPVSLTAEIIWGTNNSAYPTSGASGGMTCNALYGTGVGTGVSTTRGTSLPGTSQPIRLNTRLVPGVLYLIVMSVNNQSDPSTTAPYQGTQGYYVSASVPEGYVVELSHVPGCERVNGTFNNNAQTDFDTVLIRVLWAGSPPPLRAGMATPLGFDRKLWQISFGSAPNGVSAGTISFNALTSSATLASMFTRANLAFDGVSGTGIYLIPEATNYDIVRQIIAPQVCIDVVGSFSSGDIEMKCYHPAQRSASPDVNGYYSFTGDPFAWYFIQAQGSDAAGVIISCHLRELNLSTYTGAVAQILTTKLTRTGTAPNFTWTADDWHTGSSVVSRSVRSRSGSIETVTIEDGGGTAAQATTRTYTSYAGEPIGDEVTQESSGSSNPIVNSYSFYTGDLQSPAYGRVKIAQTNSGQWSGFTYNTEGRIDIQYAPFSDNDAPPSSLPAASGVVTTYSYVPGPWDRNSRIGTVETKINGTTTAKSITTYANETPFSSFSASHPWLGIVKATRTDYAAASSSLVTTTKFFSESAEAFYRGQVHSIERPDKVKQSFVYQNGTWNGSTFTPSANAGLDQPSLTTAAASRSTRIAVFAGTSDSSQGSAFSSYDGYPVDLLYLVPSKSTLEVTIRDGYANVVRTESYVWSSGAWQQVGRVDYTYNLSNQLLSKTDYMTGAVWSATYSAERKNDETDETGVQLTYTYDAADRVDTVTRAAVGSIAALVTKFSYDAAGRTTQQIVGYGQSETLTSSRSYDAAGRLTSESAPGPNGQLVKSYSYDPISRKVTTTLPNTGTRIETYCRDGRLLSVTGSAVVPEYYTYDKESDGAAYVRVNIGTSSSSRLRETWADWLGRTTKNSWPGFTGQAAYEEQATYESTTGRLIKNTRTGFAPILFAYDALSRPVRSGLDLTGNNILDLASSDRVSDADQYFESTGGAWWLTKIVKTYPMANSAAALIVSITRQRLTGFSTGAREETVSIDADGNTTTRTVSINPSAKTTTISTSTTGVSNPETETYVNGLPVSVTRADGLTYTTGYDSLGRRNTQVDPRTGTTTTHYKSGSLFVWWIQDPAGNTVATYGYDSAGRVTTLTNADGKIRYTSYNTLDQIVREWGDTAMPVEYGYNSYGERETMKTYRGGSGWSGSSWPASPGTADTTTWTFDGPSGLLASKADAAGKSVTYTYNARGQTATRTWARNVTTTYGYDSNTGELLSQDYSDSTPDVTYTYTRAGQLDTVTDVTGTRSFVYNGSNPLRLDALDLPAFYGSRVLTRQYDAIKRPTGFLLGTTVNASADLTQTYSYQAASGRLDWIDTASSAQTVRRFAYNYALTGSSLVSGYQTGVSGTNLFQTLRGYEAHRNLLSSLASQWNGTARTSYAYTYNALGQRATAKQSGNAFADFGGSTYYRYHYNDRGELDQAVDYFGEDATSTSSPQLVARRFGYAYDNAGNRQSATRALGTGVVEDYVPNALNQYTSRENNLAYAAGTAHTDSTIQVTGGTSTATVGRAGRYWAAETTLDNTDGPAAIELTVSATLASPAVTRTESRTASLPQATQAFTYDADGNLKTDGVWSYTYDAENRLITMTTTTGTNSAVAGGYHNRQLEFKYDYLGRRVQKRSLDSTAGTDVYRRYLYDGDNLVAEFDATGTTIGALQRSYTWGLDLADSLGATGGVGALVQITQHAGTAASYLPTYDANGNVVSLINAATGALVAAYEYSPFGELLRAEGSYAASNPFRFSTKFTDDESGLVYYGARYYSPSLGRFINRDPIAEQGGLNLYGFCGNDGINGVDYLGYSWLSKALKKLERWTRKHTPGAILLNAAATVFAPWALPVTLPLTVASESRQAWHAAQQNPQIAAVVAAIATWYIGGWGAAAIRLGQTATTVVAGASAGFAGGFVGARASGADLSTAFRAGYQGAAWGGGLAFVGAEAFGVKYKPFTWQSAAHQFVTSEVRYVVGRFAENKLGMDPWAFNGALLAASFTGNKLVGEAYLEKDGKAISTVWDNNGAHGIAGFFSRISSTGALFKNGGFGNLLAELPFDIADTLLQYQGLPDATGLKIMWNAWKPAFGHSLGALRFSNIVGFGAVDGGAAYAEPFGMVAPSGVNVFIGTGDPITGFSLGKILNWGAQVLHVPFGSGHLMGEYRDALGGP